MTDDTRIDEERCIYLAERKAQALNQKRVAEEHMSYCSDAAMALWEEMLGDAEDVLADIEAEEERDMFPPRSLTE